MNKKSILAIALCAWGTVGFSQTWKTEVERAINDGKFAVANKILDDVKGDEAVSVRVDSLRRTISRIRKDFSISPANGKIRIENMLGRTVSDSEIERWKLDKDRKSVV